MSLNLDARQRAMLEEMGIRLFMPVPEVSGGMVQAHADADAQTATQPARQQATQAAPQTAARPTLQPAHQPARQPAAEPAAEPAAFAPPAKPAAAGTDTDARAAAIADMDWATLRQAVASCTACKLCKGRTNTVFGVGDERAGWLIVGEAPGENEDLQGEPFVGQAGKLLDNMLHALGMRRGRRVYIANVLKCRPPGNRNPEPEEAAQCEPFLRRQVELLQPRIILAMGRFAVQALLNTQDPIGRLRGSVHSYNGVPVVVTYHPAYLLRNLPDKAKAWSDLCLAQSVVQQAA